MHVVTEALLHILNVLIELGQAVTAAVEGWLRAGLAQAHITGDLQTLLVSLVPILILVAAVRLLGGFLRVILGLAMILLLLQILVPMLQGR